MCNINDQFALNLIIRVTVGFFLVLYVFFISIFIIELIDYENYKKTFKYKKASEEETEDLVKNFTVNIVIVIVLILKFMIFIVCVLFYTKSKVVYAVLFMNFLIGGILNTLLGLAFVLVGLKGNVLSIIVAVFMFFIAVCGFILFFISCRSRDTFFLRQVIPSDSYISQKNPEGSNDIYQLNQLKDVNTRQLSTHNAEYLKPAFELQNVGDSKEKKGLRSNSLTKV